ncbi:hypothetical protein HXX01_02220 [Candidatus Nomurabacteria bacterium]|nr:hypothetical protein [Candidatus Nomurabacteria bacterium]
MTKNDVLYLIQQNGVGQNIECTFVSRGDGKEYISKVVNYKYNKGVIKVYLGNYNLKMHEKNLVKSSYCEFYIKEIGKKQTFALKLSSRLSSIEEKSVHISVLWVEYKDYYGEEITFRVVTN